MEKERQQIRRWAGLELSVWVSVLVGGRRCSELASDGFRAMDGTDSPGAHESSSGTGSERGDAFSAAATRSTRRASVPERHRPLAN